MLKYMRLVRSLWMIPHNSSNKGTTSMNFCLHVSWSMVSTFNIRLVLGSPVVSKKEGEKIDTSGDEAL